MYKSLFHDGECNLCKKENVKVITMGTEYSDKHDKSYCVKCSDKFKYKINHYVKKVADFFQVEIGIEDLEYFLDLDDLERCLTSYAIKDSEFVVMVNNLIKQKEFSFRNKYRTKLMLRLSKLHKNNLFDMTPFKFCIYSKARHRILDECLISCDRKISENEYKILINTMERLFPLER